VGQITHATAVDLDTARLAGRWPGSGTFFNADPQKKVGPLQFVAQFAPGLSSAGRVGGASLDIVGVERTRDHIEIGARHRTPVSPD
jgi:hypothetical protein